MNLEHSPDGAEAARSRLHPALAAAMQAERSQTPSPAVPEQAEPERSMLAVQRDPSLTERDHTERNTDTEARSPKPEALEADPVTRERTQVRWVRPTELAMHSGARATGWGLDLKMELAWRLRDHRTDRAPQHEARTGQGDRASRLPDLSIRGHRTKRPEPARSGMGLR